MLGVPWVDRAIRSNWDVIVDVAHKHNLPLPVAGDVEWEFDELGCGHYGCVLAASDESIVFKLTSDPTEAEFVSAAAALGWPEGIVRYHTIAPLASKYRRRPVFAIWREAAFDVGKLDPGYGADRKDYEVRSRLEFVRYLIIFKDHAARFREQLRYAKDPAKLWADAAALSDWAWQNVGLEEAEGLGVLRFPTTYRFIESKHGAFRLAASLRACEIIAEMMENTYLSDLVGGALAFYLDHGILLADVHVNNVGHVTREDYSKPIWVITDPGHAVFLQR